MLVWGVWVLLGLVVQGKVVISGWDQEEGKYFERVFDDAPVPFGGKVLKSVVSAKIISNENLHYFETLPSNFIFLCNISIESNSIFKSCDDKLAQNATAIIGYPVVFFNYPGKSYFLFPIPPQISPVIELSKGDYQVLMNHYYWTNFSLNVTIYPDGINPWIVAFYSPGFYTAQYIVCFLNVIAMIGSIYCIYLQVQFPLISHFVLSIEILVNLIRLINFAVDPIFSRLIFSYEVGTVLITCTIPFSLAASLLIGFFWFGTLNKKKLKDKSLLERRYKIVFTVIIISIFVIEVIADIVRVLYGIDVSVIALQQIIAIIYFITQAGIFGFYIFTGVRVIKFLQYQQATKADGQSAVLIKIKRLTIVLCVLVFLLLTLNIYFVTPAYETVIGYCFFWFTCGYVYAFLSFAHIVVFWPRKRKTRDSTVSTKT
eukprot:TRINITY_DN7473_c0_g3_i2.p1 TRINITY_DN7473_c0_g3~~TRINITY_DN7473_c0_g3_i2.p1  ORF type:complete len:429 (+),score=98.64 TRINITY_DN7473_c0_g3_i2:13-1299(+)